MKLWSYFPQKLHSIDHNWLVDAVRSSFNHPYISDEYYKTLEQQCMAIIAAQQQVSFEERDTQTLTFYTKFKNFFQ